jgi:hypothetical protein
MVNSFHNHVDRGEKQRAGVPLPSPGKAVTDHLVVTADSYIDPKDGPSDEGILKL